MILTRNKGRGTIATSRGFPAELGKHSSNIFTLPDVLIFDMVAGRYGGSFDKITGHCYLTVKRAVFNNNNQSTLGLSVISLWLSEALLSWALPFSFQMIQMIHSSSAGKPREVAIGRSNVMIIISSPDRSFQSASQQRHSHLLRLDLVHVSTLQYYI